MNPKIFDVLLRNLFKYSPLIVLSFVLLFVVHLARTYYKDAQTARKQYEELIGVRDQYNQLTQHVAELEENYAKDKDIWKKAEESWKNERHLLKGQIETLASATFTIHNFPHEQGAPDQVTDLFLKQEVRHQDQAGHLGPPVGYVQIFKQDGKTISGLYQSELSINSVVTRTKDGRYHVLAKGNYILKDSTSLRPEWLDIPYPLDITGGDIWINPVNDIPTSSHIKPRFFAAPHANLGLFTGATDLSLRYGVHADITFWGYGKTTNDLDWKLGGLGTNVNQNYLDINLLPIQYRIGNHLPLFKDLYLGPGIGVGTEGKSYFFTLTTTL